MTQLLGHDPAHRGFDPLLFLGINNLKNQEKKDVSQKLLDKISQYLVIRISELFPDEELKRLNNPEDLFSIAREKIPDINTKVQLFLNDFKREFYKKLKV